MAALTLLMIPGNGTAQTDKNHASAACRPDTKLVQLRDVPEASGLAMSRRVRGRLWTHNDSGEPVLFALDERGTVTGRLRITGTTVEDWEAVASARCGSDTCLYIGDIGDNNAKRDRITVYRVREPDGALTTSGQAEAFHAKYPDGAHDAEALLIASDGRVFIVTKGNTGPLAIYRFPGNLQTGSTMTLERVGAATKANADSHVTDGAVSADGELAVLRSRDALTFYRTADLFAGRWQMTSRVDLASLREPQGEGVALGADNTVFVAGESGGKNQGGTFARFSCVTRE